MEGNKVASLELGVRSRVVHETTTLPDHNKCRTGAVKIIGNVVTNRSGVYSLRQQVFFFNHIDVVQFMAGNMIAQCPDRCLVFVGDSFPHQGRFIQSFI